MRSAIDDIAIRHVNRVHRVGVVTKILRHFPFLLLRISWIMDEGVGRLPARELLRAEGKRGLLWNLVDTL